MVLEDTELLAELSCRAEDVRASATLFEALVVNFFWDCGMPLDQVRSSSL